MKSQITKNQHYVPQFILRNFSFNPEAKYKNRKINYLSLENNRFDSGKVINTFSEDFFYDTDNSVEDYIGKEIEHPASIVVETLLKEGFTPTDDSKDVMVKFIATQYGRTPQAEYYYIDFLNFSYSKTKSPLDYYDQEIRIVPSDDQSHRIVREMLVRTAEHLHKIFNCLEFCIFRNKTDCDFVISDHPVVFMNWLAMNKDSLILKSDGSGLQVFMPLSPTVCIFLYDKKSYHVKSNSGNVQISNVSDVIFINKLQIKNSNNFVVFMDDEDKLYLTEIASKYFGNRISKNGIVYLDDGVAVSYKKQLTINKKPHFFKFKKNILLKSAEI